MSSRKPAIGVHFVCGALAATMLLAACSHETTSQGGGTPAARSASASPSATTGATTAATASPSGTLPAKADLTRLATAWVPATCQHQAGRLVDYSYRLRPGERGRGTLWPEDGAAGSGQVGPVAADLDGDGRQEMLGVYDCDAGNDPWPEHLVAYDAAGGYLDQVDLGALTGMEHAYVLGMDARDGGVLVTTRAFHSVGTAPVEGIRKVTLKDRHLVTTPVSEPSPTATSGTAAAPTAGGATDRKSVV